MKSEEVIGKTLKASDIVGITFEKLEDIAPALKGLNEKSFNYLREYLPGTKTNRLSVDAPIGGRVKVYLTRYPRTRINNISDLNEVYSVETEDIFGMKNYVNPDKEQPVPLSEVNSNPEGVPHAYKTGEISNIERLVLSEMSKKLDVEPSTLEPKMSRNIDDTYPETRDMLKTQVMPVINPENEINIDDPKQVEVPTPTPVSETPVQKVAEPVVTESPKIVPSKTLTLNNKDNKQSGVADAIIISVIVIVYIAIIVNLILRLK